MNHNDAHSRLHVHPTEAVSDAPLGAACWNAATPRALCLGQLTVTAPLRARTRAQTSARLEGGALATADAADVLGKDRRQAAHDPELLARLDAQEARRRESEAP